MHAVKMYYFMLLLAVIPSIKASSVCSYPDYALCGSDGKTYRNKCEWNDATLLNPALVLRHPGSCQEPLREQLYEKLKKANGNKYLRSRYKSKRKRTKLSSSNNILNFGLYDHMGYYSMPRGHCRVMSYVFLSGVCLQPYKLPDDDDDYNDDTYEDEDIFPNNEYSN